MKLIKPSVEIIEQNPGIDGINEIICDAAATCYKSWPKVGEPAQRFVDTLIKNGHLAMLEFGTVYLTIPKDDYEDVWNECKCPYSSNPFSWVNEDDENYYITTNYRVLVENSWLGDLKECMTEPTENHQKRHAVKFVISIGTGREFTRHRAFSFAQESTRYCKYSQDRFDKEVTFIIPSWSNSIGEGTYSRPLRPDEGESEEVMFSWGCYEAEKFYLDMADICAAQKAREVLPLCTKSELCMCGFENDWKHFFELRKDGTTGTPHPDAYLAASLLWEKFKNKGIAL